MISDIIGGGSMLRKSPIFFIMEWGYFDEKIQKR